MAANQLGFKMQGDRLRMQSTDLISRKFLDSQIIHFQLKLDFFSGFANMILETHEYHSR